MLHYVSSPFATPYAGRRMGEKRGLEYMPCLETI